MKRIMGIARSRINYVVWIFYTLNQIAKGDSMKSRSMDIFTFNVMFPDGAQIQRTEWGKSRHDALKTLMSIYGVLNEDFYVKEAVAK